VLIPRWVVDIQASTVLCHEVSESGTVFFCTQECVGPYQRHVLRTGVELREAARATSAAPSYFQEMTIQGRSFVDGGFGETNNPSWESHVHYRQNHSGAVRQQAVIINIGTGSVPPQADLKRLQKRPWWSKVVPKSLEKALGLVADLVKMATESEKPAERLRYLAGEYPEDYFFKRFSANTGIHDISLDDWRAVSGKGKGGTSMIEERTQEYLGNPEVLKELKEAAEKLAEVYTRRHKRVETLSPLAPVGDAVPSLIIGSATSQTPSLTPPRTPELGHVAHLPALTVENKEVLRGQGQQFGGQVSP
jgi:hypothetical protein